MRAVSLFRQVALASAVTLAVSANRVGPAYAADAPRQEVIFQAPDLRIYRILGRHGAETFVLTNMDEEGNLLSPGGEPTPCPEPAPEPPTLAPRGEAATPVPAAPAAESGSQPIVIVNVNLPSSPVLEPNPSTWGYPVVSFGGLPGPYRYPERHHFLGYGPDISSPSLFGGLGLNAGNRFGLSIGTPCGRGFDCMFGPRSETH